MCLIKYEAVASLSLHCTAQTRQWYISLSNALQQSELEYLPKCQTIILACFLLLLLFFRHFAFTDKKHGMRAHGNDMHQTSPARNATVGALDHVDAPGLKFCSF